MGLSASQARFLQLTARRSNVEYQAQQINQQRTSLANKLTEASTEYQDATNNKKLVYAYNDGTGPVNVDLTYRNYKTFMNLQDGANSTQKEFYLMSSSGNKIAVASEEDMRKMIDASFPTKTVDKVDKEGNIVGETVLKTADELTEDEKKRTLCENDFIIIDNLNDPDTFQDSIQKGYLYFATRDKNDTSNEYEFNIQSWDTIGGSAISEVYDTADDAAAEAKYKSIQTEVQSADKQLELRLNQLDTERDAIKTEMESISKVIDDNIEHSFKVFS